ncbi:hypothetical protein [Paenibacillus koleovorans]|uniref:hypothetical protein n=1 Tax=Paenibacillus koleovorans TaxID=121608 RepID=UPI000FD8E513|nr:hypothetical protein [Paenibacillus koleovorans]
MLMWEKPELIEGCTVYRDHADTNMYYILPGQPGFRIDDNGHPVFKFIKYKFPVDRPDGKKGGGFLIADVEFTVPEDKLAKIKATLQERIDQSWKTRRLQPPAPQVKIGQMSFLRGTASITVLDNGGALVEQITSPGAPSLYGKMITPFTVELSPEGATLLEKAMQDKGGVVQVAYDLWMPVRLPAITATVWFSAEKLMEFHQAIDVEENFWSEDSYRETLQQKMIESNAGGVDINPGGVTDAKVINTVRDWAWKTMEDAVAKMILGDIPPVDPKEANAWYTEHDIENINRDIVVRKAVSFRRTYKEGAVMEWNPAPRGTLPNITSLKGRDGKLYEWKDYALEVDLNDPFFKQLNVTARANADFEKLPLDSVEVKITYKEGAEHAVKEYALRKPDDVGKFTTFIANNSYNYKYSYQVNYKNASRSYQSPEFESDEQHLTISVGDTGILLVDIATGDLNFDQVKEASVTLQYEDPGNGVALMEQVFKLNKDHPAHNWTQVLVQPKRNPYRYQVKYFMADGKEFKGDWQSSGSSQLFIDDPFSASKTVNIRGFGNFDTRIDTIFVDLEYRDETNGYMQNHSLALSKESTFEDWTFPVISDQSGQVAYSASIRFKDGTVEPIAKTFADSNTILLGDAVLYQEIEVLPDLVDFDAVKLIKVTLHYTDEAKGIDESGDLVFKKGAASSLKWAFPYKDKTKRSYDWSASYFMADGSVKKVPATRTAEGTLVLPETPA